MPDSSSDLPTEAALRLLLKEERRRVIRTLAERQRETTVDQLAAALCESPAATPRGSRTVDEGDLDDAVLDLLHVHIPVLRDGDVIVYDPQQETVRRGEQFRPVRNLLAAIDAHRDGALTDTA
ncbi:DUF7344 domain-containing protein [Halorubellus salinus]|uniref:DUF7344 domain-containing protein n=1 Tax=Halorubellus salinus TaxID=755309 RepID=UPI001D091702|nr:hypothetical protein [Halorubellus salinus]